MKRLCSTLSAVKTRLLAPLERFFRIEAASGVILLAAAAVALSWANSPWLDAYRHLWHASIPLGIGRYSWTQSLHFWINDGLMTIFFLLVGLEIRREMHNGALSSLRLAALPLVAALGGVIVPALVYSALNTDPQSRQGWAVPTATDIAFAIGVLVLLGKRVPAQLRILLLALAIIDDIAAILIIAFFYSGGIEIPGLLITGAGVLGVGLMRKLRPRFTWTYAIPGLILWVGLLQAGIHPTLAGVILGLMIPVVTAERLSDRLHPWVAFGIMPLFALANAGVNLGSLAFAEGPASTVALGIFFGLVAGKPLGILLASFLGVKLGLCELPPKTTWRGVFVVGCLGGIGFTMAIFIANLAFAARPELLVTAKLAVLGASFASACLGSLMGWQLLRNDNAMVTNSPSRDF